MTTTDRSQDDTWGHPDGYADGADAVLDAATTVTTTAATAVVVTGAALAAAIVTRHGGAMTTLVVALIIAVTAVHTANAAAAAHAARQSGGIRTWRWKRVSPALRTTLALLLGVIVAGLAACATTPAHPAITLLMWSSMTMGLPGVLAVAVTAGLPTQPSTREAS